MLALYEEKGKECLNLKGDELTKLSQEAEVRAGRRRVEEELRLEHRRVEVGIPEQSCTCKCVLM